MKYSYIIATFIIGSIILSLSLGFSIIFAFIISTLFTLFVLAQKGHLIKNLLMVMGRGIFQYWTLYLLILLIGANISMWMAAGIVPVLMHYGFDLMQGTNFLLVAFIITAVVSIFMGTAVGTIGTIGIALLGIGQGFGLPPGVLMGVLVSGAFIADKISPLSGLFNLTMKVTNTSYRQAMGAMIRTFLPVLFLTSGGYWLLGQAFVIEDSNLIQTYKQAIELAFNISPLLLLLPLVTVLLPLLGVKIVPTILLGLGGGMVLATTVQNVALPTALSYVLTGYVPASQSVTLNAILGSTGVVGMLEVVAIVIVVIALGNLLEAGGVLNPLLYQPISRVRSKGTLVLKTGVVGMLLTTITCDQTVGIVFQGKLYQRKYQELGLSNSLLARTISDTSTIVAPLIPWNINALIVVTATGISAWQYAPWAFLCYLFPLTTVAIWGKEYFKQRSLTGAYVVAPGREQNK